MRKLSKITESEKNEIAGILMDKKKQDELLNSQNHKNEWMLDFVFDSTLRDGLFKESVV